VLGNVFDLEYFHHLLIKVILLRETLPDEKQLSYLHRIDNVLFSHGGLADSFVRRYVPAGSYNDVDAALQKINSLGWEEMWQDASPIWYRPQYYEGRLYKPRKLLQVVGHTPVGAISRKGNLIYCDVFGKTIKEYLKSPQDTKLPRALVIVFGI